MDLDSFYRVHPWSFDDQARYREARNTFSRLLDDHPWLRGLVEARSRVRVLDAMGGHGLGGLALGSELEARGLGVEVTVLDLQGGVEEKVERLAGRLGVGFPVRGVRGDVARVWEAVGGVFDIVLVYGYNTPHLDPYQMVRALAGFSSLQPDDGVLLVEEMDRVYGVLISVGYKEILVEEAGERLVVSYHAGYDVRRGMALRLLEDRDTGERVLGEVRFWDIAGLASLLWAFYEDVDFWPYTGRRGRLAGLLLGYKPRRKLGWEDFSRDPRILGGEG